MLRLDSFRERLHQTLSRITPEKIVGASGLAILCAASTLALAPPSDQALLTTLMQWLGGLGLNVLAGILQQEYQNLLSQPARDEQERLTALAEALTKHFRRQAELRREIGAFLSEENLNAFRIAEEVVQGNPAVHGWLLARIYEDVTEYRADFDQIHKSLAEMKSLVEQLQQPAATTHETNVVIGQLNRLLAQTQRSYAALGSLIRDQDDQTKLRTLKSARESKEELPPHVALQDTGLCHRHLVP